MDELERRSLIDRHIDPDDRRTRVLCLNKKGDALRLKIRPHMQAVHERFVSPLAAGERVLFLDLLYRVVAGTRPRGDGWLPSPKAKAIAKFRG